eukprot:Lankesteria_metandrocarpae@DN5000_c0_g2_i1.p1
MADKHYKTMADEHYQTSLNYWKEQDASNNGMLGGYDSVSKSDLQASTAFLKSVLRVLSANSTVTFNRALDCGAGIGRVTRGSLLGMLKTVDMLEPVEKFLDQAKILNVDLPVDKYICCGLQEFVVQAGRYDVIWVQWCALYLRDRDFVDFLKKAKLSLTKTGVICVKENVILDECGNDHHDEDNSVTRMDSDYKNLFTQAGLTLLLESRQPNFPKPLYPVKMYCVL